MNNNPIQPDDLPDDFLLQELTEALRALPSETARPSMETDAAILAEAGETIAAFRRRRVRGHFWPALAAAACIALAFTLLTRPDAPRVIAVPAPAEDKYALILREVTAVFPEQVKAIIADGGELRISLAEQPIVTARQAVVVELCENQKCTTIITYIGQTVEVGGHTVTVRTDEKGSIVVDTADDHADHATTGFHVRTRRI